MKTAPLALLSLLLLTLGAAGCKSSLPSDVDTICNAETRAKLGKTEDVRERALKLSNYVNEHLKTESGRQLFSKLFTISPKQRIEKLRAEARRAGLGGCPLADSWAKEIDGDGSDGAKKK
ncbi:MAG: hypothetical protein KC503_26175 [Myxococcales bacterium]|nr:hypothetical protein [Myxococcales bacterium]